MPRSYSPDVDSNLPFIDEHQVVVSAPALAVWHALTAEIPRFAGSEAFAHLLGTEPRRASGGPIREGATLPGFKVAEAVPGHRLRLTGRHRFSQYEFVLTLAAHPDGTVLSARTNAGFPGLRGYGYRGLVIGSGIHGVLVARLLRTVRRQVEGQSVR